MSETYPEDIMTAARAIAHVVFIAGPEQDDLADAIASALLAERERATKAENKRCAAIAESFNDATYRLPTHPDAVRIASGIRKGPST
jgi:hypothetical protein